MNERIARVLGWNSFTNHASTIMIELAGYPSKGYAVDSIVSLMTDMATVRYELGYACAMSVVLFIMMVAARLIVGKVLKMFEK